MKINTVFALLLFPVLYHAQVVVDGQNINALPGVYFCRITGVETNFLGSKVAFYVDYGQDRKDYRKAQAISDTTGKAKIFTGVVDALNFMAGNGWGYVSSSQVSEGGTLTQFFLFRREEPDIQPR